jgi:uncharacterized protein (DUF427 family)
MSDRRARLPGPEHPISIEATAGRVVVTAGARVIADTRAALTLREAAYAPTYYLPRSDADMALLERTSHATWCPYKGECCYFSIPLGGERSVNAVWSYEAPYPAVAGIAGYLAFYRERIDTLKVTEV